MPGKNIRVEQLASMYKHKQRQGWSDSDIRSYLERTQKGRLKNDISWSDIKSTVKRSTQRKEDFNEYTANNPNQPIMGNQPGKLTKSDPNQPGINKRISSQEYNQLKQNQQPQNMEVKNNFQLYEISTPRGKTTLKVDEGVAAKLEQIRPEDWPEDYNQINRSGYPGLVPVNDFSEITSYKDKKQDWSETWPAAAEVVLSPGRGALKTAIGVAGMQYEIAAVAPAKLFNKTVDNPYSAFGYNPKKAMLSDPDVQNLAIAAGFAAGWSYAPVKLVGEALILKTGLEAAANPTPQTVGTAIGLISVIGLSKVVEVGGNAYRAGSTYIKGKIQSYSYNKLVNAQMMEGVPYVNFESVTGATQRNLYGKAISEPQIKWLRSEVGRTNLKQNVPESVGGIKWESLYPEAIGKSIERFPFDNKGSGQQRLIADRLYRNRKTLQLETESPNLISKGNKGVWIYETPGKQLTLTDPSYLYASKGLNLNPKDYMIKTPSAQPVPTGLKINIKFKSGSMGKKGSAQISELINLELGKGFEVSRPGNKYEPFKPIEIPKEKIGSTERLGRKAVLRGLNKSGINIKNLSMPAFKFDTNIGIKNITSLRSSTKTDTLTRTDTLTDISIISGSISSFKTSSQIKPSIIKGGTGIGGGDFIEIPSPPDIPFFNDKKRKGRRARKSKLIGSRDPMTSKYLPTIAAMTKGIMGKRPKIITGINVRPIGRL